MKDIGVFNILNYIWIDSFLEITKVDFAALAYTYSDAERALLIKNLGISKKK